MGAITKGGPMKPLLVIICALLLAPAVLFALDAEELQVFKHPVLEFQFKASKNWRVWPRPESKLAYEVAAPDSSIHVVLWYTTTEQDAGRYLWKMSGMKDIDLENEKPTQEKIGGRDAWVLRAQGRERNANVQMILAVIPRGMSKQHPKEHELFIVQIWCAAQTAVEHKKTMEALLAGVEIAD